MDWGFFFVGWFSVCFIGVFLFCIIHIIFSIFAKFCLLHMGHYCLIPGTPNANRYVILYGKKNHQEWQEATSKTKNTEIVEVLLSCTLPEFPRCGSRTMLRDTFWVWPPLLTDCWRDRTANTEALPTLLPFWGQWYFWKNHYSENNHKSLL